MDKPVPTVTYTFFGRPQPVRRTANRTPSAETPVLAAFDPDSAVVWANQVLAATIERNRESRRVLRDEDTETLAHEFARVLQYRDIFREHFSYKDRVAALRKRRAQTIMRSTSESYANRKLFEERQAEETVQRIRMEILNAFGRAQRVPAHLTRDLSARAEESAGEFIQTLRSDYLSSARKEFARLHGTLNAADLNDDDTGPAFDRGKVYDISRIRWLFPTRLSPTLADLVDEMVELDIKIAIADPGNEP
jgi:hypothetical protein